MAEIPDRYRKSYEDGPGWVQPVYEELGAAEARIRELEQERDRSLEAFQRQVEHTSLHLGHVAQFLKEMYEVMIDPLYTGDLKVSQITAALLDAAKRDRETANMHGDALGALQAQLQAVTQERDALLVVKEILEDRLIAARKP